MIPNSKENPWFTPLTINHSPANMTLFCFHYAGGSASVFRPWVKNLTNSTEIIAIQLPGRENRFTEPPLHTLELVIENLIRAFSDCLDKPFIFFGHSVGAIICFELAHALQKYKKPLPQHLIVSGAQAPHIPLRRKKIHNLPEPDFISELSAYNGLPSILNEDLELLSLFIPMIRADFTISETYTYNEKPALPCPITAFGGIDDPYVLVEDLSCWKFHTSNDFKQHLFKGDHFFLTKESSVEALKIIDEIIYTEIRDK